MLTSTTPLQIRM